MPKRVLYLSAAIILASAGIFFRAANARSARTQANQIVKADTAGTDTHVALASLKTFTQNHMGASITFTLTGAYARAQAAAQAVAAQAAAAAAANSQIYADAQRLCSGKSDSIVQAHCNQAYLAAHLANIPPPPAPVPTPKLSDYQYNLKSPFWTSDLAGALFLGSIVALGFSLPFGRKRRKVAF